MASWMEIIEVSSNSFLDSTFFVRGVENIARFSWQSTSSAD